MLTLKSCTVAYVSVIVVLGVTDIVVALSPLLYGGVTVLYLAALVYGSARVDSQFYLTTVNRASTDRKEIALTFDDGPVAESTPALLEVLKASRAEASFFVIGRKATEQEEIIRRIDADHHLIGNHTYSHSPWFNLSTVKDTVEELRTTEETVARIIGRKTRLFRPPFGVTNPTLKHAVEALGYTVVGWSVRSFDTVLKNENAIVERVTRNIRPGAVVLFHETTPNIAVIVKNLLLTLGDLGYEVVRIDKLLGVGGYR